MKTNDHVRMLSVMAPDRKELEHWQSELGRMIDTPCGFRHHSLGDEDDKPLCPGNVSNYHLGCAHAYHFVLPKIIGQMQKAGFLRTEESDEYRRRIEHKGELARLDLDFALSVMSPAQYRQNIVGPQIGIIQQRKHVVDALRMKVAEALCGTAPGTSGQLPEMHLSTDAIAGVA